MKKVNISTAKRSSEHDIQNINKLLGKRTKSIVLINNIQSQGQVNTTLKGQEGTQKRFKGDVEKNTIEEGIVKKSSSLRSQKKASTKNTQQLCHHNSLSTNSEEMKEIEHRDLDMDCQSEDSDSLTASDFEILNCESFYDRINDVLQQMPQNKNSTFDIKQQSSTHGSIKSLKQNSKPQFNKSTSLATNASQSDQVTEASFKMPIVIDEATGLPRMPAYDKNINYQDEYWNIYLQNQALLAQIDKVALERNDFLFKGFSIENFYDQNMDRFQSERYSSGRKKHNRRCANDIERKYKCPYVKCEKFYGSEGSLNLHIKIKHNGGNKTDREKIAKSIVFANANGISIPDVLEVNLPPGSVERAATQVGLTLDAESLDKLEQDITARNEKAAKKMKEIEMSKVQQFEIRDQLIMLPPHQKSSNIPFNERPQKFNQHHSYSQPSHSNENDENAMQYPSKYKLTSSKGENAVLGKQSSAQKPIRKAIIAFAESTNIVQNSPMKSSVDSFNNSQSNKKQQPTRSLSRRL